MDASQRQQLEKYVELYGYFGQLQQAQDSELDRPSTRQDMARRVGARTNVYDALPTGDLRDHIARAKTISETGVVNRVEGNLEEMIRDTQPEALVQLGMSLDVSKDNNYKKFSQLYGRIKKLKEAIDSRDTNAMLAAYSDGVEVDEEDFEEEVRNTLTSWLRRDPSKLATECSNMSGGYLSQLYQEFSEKDEKGNPTKELDAGKVRGYARSALIATKQEDRKPFYLNLAANYLQPQGDE